MITPRYHLTSAISCRIFLLTLRPRHMFHSTSHKRLFSMIPMTNPGWIRLNPLEMIVLGTLRRGVRRPLTSPPPDESPPSQDESRPSSQRRQDHLLGSLDASRFESARIGAQGSYMMSQEDNVRFISPNVVLSPLTGNPRAFTQDC